VNGGATIDMSCRRAESVNGDNFGALSAHLKPLSGVAMQAFEKKASRTTRNDRGAISKKGKTGASGKDRVGGMGGEKMTMPK